MRFLVFIVIWVVVGCSRVDDRPGIVVSIAPLSWIASNLVDSTVSVSIMVPPGSSPESYEPTMSQMQSLGRASTYISTGLLDFEGELSGRIGDIAPSLTILNLSSGMDVMEGSCGHTHGSEGNHAHGADPHIWLSPRLMRIMVDKVAELLVSKNLNPSEAVMRRADSLKSLIDSLDRNIQRLIGKRHITFAIVHPSLSYYARDYWMTQIAIEIEGKEPSARALSGIITTLKKEGIKFVLYDIQNSNAAAQVVATEVGATMIEYNPLSENWLDGMLSITRTLCNATN